MNLSIDLDPSQPRVAVGDEVNIFSNGTCVGSATVKLVDHDKCTLDAFIENGYEVKQTCFNVEEFKAQANKIICKEYFKYYLSAQKNK